MKRLLLLAALMLGLAAPAFAKGAAETAAGHYFLEGVMETGSELLLRPDGKFQYYFTYGALDLLAEGDWREDKGHVHLITRKKQSNAPDGQPQAFDTLDLTVAPTGEGKPALETDLWGRHVTYVRHGNGNPGN